MKKHLFLISAICLSLIACHSKKPAPAAQAEKPKVQQEAVVVKQPKFETKNTHPVKSFYFEEIKAEIHFPKPYTVEKLENINGDFGYVGYVLSSEKSSCPDLEKITFATRDSITKEEKALSDQKDDGGDAPYPQPTVAFVDNVERVTKNQAPVKSANEEWEEFTCKDIKTIKNRKFCAVNHDQSEYGGYDRKYFTYINQKLVGLEFVLNCYQNEAAYDEVPRKDFPIAENTKLADQLFPGVEIR